MITRNLLLLVLQELAVVLITLLPLVSVNISKDERYISKGLKVPPISKSFICDHFGCIERSVNSAHSSGLFQIHTATLRSVNRSDDGTTEGVDWTLESDLKTCYASSI